MNLEDKDTIYPKDIDQVHLEKVDNTWERLKKDILNLSIYPYFKNFVRIYIDYKVKTQVEINPNLLDELVLTMEMINIIDVQDLIDIIKTDCKGFISLESIKVVLLDNFSLLRLDLIDQKIIEELIKLLLHLHDQQGTREKYDKN